MIAKIKQLPPGYIHPQGFTCPTGFWAVYISDPDKPDFIDDRKWHLVNHLQELDIEFEVEL